MPDDNHYAHPLDMVVNLVRMYKCGDRCTLWMKDQSALLGMEMISSNFLQDMNTRKVVAIWHHEGSEYQVPRVNSNFHRGVIEQPWRTGPKSLDIMQVQCIS
jgi:hypothetical protein